MQRLQKSLQRDRSMGFDRATNWYLEALPFITLLHSDRVKRESVCKALRLRLDNPSVLAVVPLRLREIQTSSSGGLGLWIFQFASLVGPTVGKTLHSPAAHGRDLLAPETPSPHPCEQEWGDGGQGGIDFAPLDPRRLQDSSSGVLLDWIYRLTPLSDPTGVQTLHSPAAHGRDCLPPETPSPHPCEQEWGDGGQGGIRTLGTVSRTHAFQASPFDHSGTCPWRAETREPTDPMQPFLTG